MGRGADGPAVWRLGAYEIALDRPVIAGVLNVTPDSFSDGGRFFVADAAIARAHRLVEEGAGLVDVGAESTRPGAEPVPAEEEWRRLRPVLAGLRDLPVPLSVDTMKAEVAERAIDAGASAINDVSGLRSDPSLAGLAARTGAGLVVGHMRGTPRTMQADTAYDDLIGEVRDALSAARAAALAAGCPPDRVAIDPGIGFGKSLEGNLELLARLDEVGAIGAPLWIGPSRKTFIGQVLGDPGEERLEGTVAACVLALTRGAHVFRVHDVAPVRRALEVAEAVWRRRSDDIRPVAAGAGLVVEGPGASAPGPAGGDE